MASAPAQGSAPLYVGRTLIYPNLCEPIQKDPAADLPFYFTLYGHAADVVVHAQLLRNGEAVAEAPVPLSSVPGARLQHVGRMPIGALPIGTYELRIRAADGVHEVSRTVLHTPELNTSTATRIRDVLYSEIVDIHSMPR